MSEKASEWNEYQRLVLHELERLGAGIDAVDRKLDTVISTDLSKINVEIAMLKVKAGIWGLMGGMIPAVGLVLLHFLKASQ